MTRPETNMTIAASARILQATRQNAQQATAKAIRRGIIAGSSPVRADTATRGRRGIAFPTWGVPYRDHWTFIRDFGFGAEHGRWANIGRAFCDCS